MMLPLASVDLLDTNVPVLLTTESVSPRQPIPTQAQRKQANDAARNTLRKVRDGIGPKSAGKASGLQSGGADTASAFILQLKRGSALTVEKVDPFFLALVKRCAEVGVLFLKKIVANGLLNENADLKKMEANLAVFLDVVGFSNRQHVSLGVF